MTVSPSAAQEASPPPGGEVSRPRLKRVGGRLSSLRWRLTLAISGVVLLSTAVCVAAAVIFLSQTLTNRETTDLKNTLTAVSGYMANQRTDLLGAATLVANDTAVGRAVRNDDHQSLVVDLTPYYADLNADVLDVIDAQGRVVVRMEDTLTSGDVVLALPSVRRALQGQGVVAAEDDLLNREPVGRFALRATVPIRRGDRIIGAVVVGRQLGSIFAYRISRALNANVNLIAGGQRTGTTLTDSHGLPATGLPEPQTVLNRVVAGTSSIATVRENGQSALSGIVPLKGSDGHFPAAIEVIRPLGSLYDVIRLLSLLLLLLGAAVVVVGTVLALSISRRLTSRLQVLDVTASRVASMAKSDEPLGDLHVVETVQGTDEVASLAGSFSAMMSALDEHIAAKAQLYDAAQARVRELTGLAEIARLLTAVPSVAETMDLLGEHVCRLVGCSGVAIWLPGEGDLPALQGGHNLPDDYAAQSNELIASMADDGFETVAQEALRTGLIVNRPLPQLSDDLPDKQMALLRVLRSQGWNGATAAPLRIQGQVIGALTCYAESASPLSSTDLSLLSTIADQVAVAIENARLAVEAQEKAALEERRQGEEALRASEIRFRTLVEQSPFAIQIYDPDGRSLLVNQAHRDLWRLPEDYLATFNALTDRTVESMGVMPYVHRAFAGEAVELPPVHYRGAYSTSPDARQDESDGYGRWIQIYVYPVKDENETIREVIAVSDDITERIQAEEQLREKEAQYRGIFQSTSDGVMILTMDSTIIEANPALCQIYGYDYDELIGMNAANLSQPDSLVTTEELLRKSDAGEAVDLRGISIRKDGTLFNREGRATIFMYRGERHILVVVRDVTEEVKAYGLLEQRVAERTRELTTLLQVSHNVASTLEREPLLQLILDQLKSVIDYTDASIVAREGDELYTIGNQGPLPQEVVLHGRFPLDPRIPTWDVFMQGETVIIDDVLGAGPQAEGFRLSGGEMVGAIGVRSWMGVPMILGDRVIGCLSLSHRSPGFYSARDATLALAIASQAAVAIENARLYEETSERTRELTSLLDVSHNVASTLELEPLLGLVLDQLKIVADYADAGILELIGEDLQAIGYRGPLPQEAALQLRFPIDPHLPTWPVIKHRETIIIDDVRGDSPLARAYQEAVGVHLETTYEFVRCFMAVPMILGDRVIGALTLSHSRPGHYTYRQAALVRAIANQAAIAIENARLFTQAQEVAVLEERQRLARELHDSVSQALYGIALGAKTAQTLLERDPQKIRDPLEYILAQAEAGLTEMRALIFELRPESLEKEGLVVALGKQAEALRARHGIAVDAELGAEPAVSFAVKEAVYRIAQEALHNTVKHAHAQTVDLRMDWNPEGIDLEITDDGAGFDPSKAFPGHLGLRTMRERATRLGGTLKIESMHGDGTRVHVHVPCEALAGRTHTRVP